MIFLDQRQSSNDENIHLFDEAQQHYPKFVLKGGSIAQRLAHLPLDPAALSLIPNIPKKNSEEKIVDVPEVKQWRCYE